MAFKKKYIVSGFYMKKGDDGNFEKYAYVETKEFNTKIQARIYVHKLMRKRDFMCLETIVLNPRISETRYVASFWWHSFDKLVINVKKKHN